MKKSPLLNAEISHVIARLGHTDQLVIADAGFYRYPHLPNASIWR
ncbi:D-ribose pyranose/furanose isomerase RbsD [Ewingella americana]